MNIQEFKIEIKREMARDLKKAIQELEDSICCDSELFDEFIMSKGRFSEINRAYSSGIIERGYFDLERNKIIKGLITMVNRLSSNDLIINQVIGKTITEESQKNENIDSYEMNEPGVWVNEQYETKIYVSPTVFFDNRLGKAFPGIRGLKWFDNPEIALYRLSLLLKFPLVYDKWGNEADPSPIWWFRGNSNNSIRTFKTISKTKCLINFWEVEIERMAVYKSERYYRHFIYIETKPESPTGVYNYSKESLDDMIDSFGYAFEEYGIIQGYNVTREEFDDGATEIGGKIIESNERPELRRRFFTKFNFIIAAKFSPYNSREYDMKLDSIFKKLLNTRIEIEELIEVVKDLPKHRLDF